MMRRLGTGLATALLAVVMTASGAAAFELTKAQALLFDTNHLRDVAGDTTLRYRFEKAGALEAGFTDSVEMTVTAVDPDGRKDLEFRFLTGERAVPFDAMHKFRGNPLIMLFLERDAREMKRLTGGSELYFRNRLRNAFAAAAAEVKPATVTWQDRSVPATEVVVRPFVAVELIERFPRFEHKEYHFILADAVPGGLYAVHAFTPGADGPLTDESMVLTDTRTAAAVGTAPVQAAHSQPEPRR
ncbi:hypothetical protein [Azospirillum halopraeferens]|uniref:hypothetical protein n=1 Tax=Azospirillum halopraeferens TaxID=34010 RepID=UPI0003FC3986|nr:hypothetical protein [Azospirillum halopraeferens]